MSARALYQTVRRVRPLADESHNLLQYRAAATLPRGHTGGRSRRQPVHGQLGRRRHCPSPGHAAQRNLYGHSLRNGTRRAHQTAVGRTDIHDGHGPAGFGIQPRRRAHPTRPASHVPVPERQILLYGFRPAQTTLDVFRSTVGGYASDGWFKMFEFFEVPSQMIGAIGPVANGTNFDWARQDFKPGLINLNLIIDEEVYLSVLGKQAITQQNGQGVGTDGTTAQVPHDQFAQQHLNFNQDSPNSAVPALGPTRFTEQPVATAIANGTALPDALGRWIGTNPTRRDIHECAGLARHGLPAHQHWPSGQRPVTNSVAGCPTLYNNALKASFIQFLSLRHGGSGYLFGHGTGHVGVNLAVTALTTPNEVDVPLNTSLPADISVPFAVVSRHRPNRHATGCLAAEPVYEPAAQQRMYPLTRCPFSTATYYPASDPGVRNPLLYPGSTNATATGRDHPPGPTPSSPLLRSIRTRFPARRLFQVPDAYNPGVAATDNDDSSAKQRQRAGRPLHQQLDALSSSR